MSTPQVFSDGLALFLQHHEDMARGLLRSIGYEVGHEFFMRRGEGKYVDEIITVAVNPGVAEPIIIQLDQGESGIIEAYGWHNLVPGEIATLTMQLSINNQVVRGYGQSIYETCPGGVLDWNNLTKMDVFAHPGAVIRVRCQNVAGAATTILARIRVRLVPYTYGPIKRP
jgi:hypothetical protein